MGGIKQVVLTIAGALSGVLMPLLTKGLSSVGQRIAQWSGKTARDLSKMRADIAGQI
jgi:hypothetical protein